MKLSELPVGHAYQPVSESKDSIYIKTEHNSNYNCFSMTSYDTGWNDENEEVIDFGLARLHKEEPFNKKALVGLPE